MGFRFFEHRRDTHLRRSREYLEEANVARVEHQAAAEHHAALAKMYAQRIVRIEEEILSALHSPSMVVPASADALSEDGNRGKGESVLAYPSRAFRT
ncbi:hypothetical protein B2J86_08550 [Acidovorax sp. SRB_14]|uniref:hypothetical protein n=1 Tax=unclassified Acidovorax TaxID=2684926 RepID=UPI00145FCA21|nr:MULTISPECIES: hypothetical protein [unclassified Acidovorax]NMM77494.1 hypothetical protein [Acidovorax sp. SRB_24]NMM80970.1 hypothetical protein [Acidovorax sp. SRB_14]NMM89008.1 hypothetical protein [Rhodococcus sp. SRB_17]